MFTNGSSSSSEASRKDALNNIDPYALVEALTGRKLERPASASSTKTLGDDYDDLGSGGGTLGEEPEEDNRPDEEPCVGAINPYALVEAMLGHKIDKRSMSSSRIISDVLQTDYDELFDMKNQSVLFAGLRLNREQRRAEELDENDVKILKEKDLVTPDLSRVQRVDDLEKIGLKDLGDARVKMARMQNGKLRLVVEAGKQLGRTVSNRDVTMTLNEYCLPYRRGNNGGNGDRNRGGRRGRWTPPNSEWRDVERDFERSFSQRMMTEFTRFNGSSYGGYGNINMYNRCHQQTNRFDDPVQGALGNSWFVSALFSVFWADPSMINRATRTTEDDEDYDDDYEFDDDDGNNGGNNGGNGGGDRDRPRPPPPGRGGRDRNDRDRRRRRRHHHLAIKFHDQGGRMNSKTQTVEVDYEIPINNSSNDPVYCRSSDGADVWPALYEKAFAKWVCEDRNSQDRPDITQLAHGDPIKCMAQINGRQPHYYFNDQHEHQELVTLVRNNSLNFKCINPMAAYTHACSGGQGRSTVYRGANLVANHAYSVLGWTSHGDRQYIILRNPWGVTEPIGLTSYPGLVDRVEPEFWRPACMLNEGGVLAMEAHAFKEYFACIGVAK